MRCVIFYTSLVPYMGTIISTILAFFGASGGSGPVNAGFPGFRPGVGTSALALYSTIDQVVRAICIIVYMRSGALHHMLYSCNVLYNSELGEGGPIPPNGGSGRCRGRNYPFKYLQFFSTHVLAVSTPKIFST